MRPYSSKAKILPEQTIGRGLRLMFRDRGTDYAERVDVMGNKAFIEFVEELEQSEDITLETFEVGRDRLQILTIMPLTEKIDRDIGVPQLSPLLVRKKSLAHQIDALDVMALDSPVLPRKRGDSAEKSFSYEGYDIITLEKIIDRSYTIPSPQTAQEVIGYYARHIANEVKLPSQFASLVSKLREFFECKAFGEVVDLTDKSIIDEMSSNVASYVVKRTFGKALREKIIDRQDPVLSSPEKLLSSTPPFPHSGPYFEASKSVFNYVACSRSFFELDFAKFLESAEDVEAFSKLSEPFGFSIEYTDSSSNLRHYYPDFVVRLINDENWIVETKGQETTEVIHKDISAQVWCESASNLTNHVWRYVKIPQIGFEQLKASMFNDLLVFDTNK